MWICSGVQIRGIDSISTMPFAQMLHPQVVSRWTPGVPGVGNPMWNPNPNQRAPSNLLTCPKRILLGRHPWERLAFFSCRGPFSAMLKTGSEILGVSFGWGFLDIKLPIKKGFHPILLGQSANSKGHLSPSWNCCEKNKRNKITSVVALVSLSTPSLKKNHPTSGHIIP